MVAAAGAISSDPPHIPVLLGPLLDAVAPVTGTWVDGTFGAGGYARGLLAAGAERVIGIDRDPDVFEMAEGWAADFGNRLVLRQGTFSKLDELAGGPVDGVVLDLGVSSMQLDRPERGFSFGSDGPLDMRMSRSGPTAADLVNSADETELADILYHYGEERASRRIARAIVAARATVPLVTTAQLAQIVESCLPSAQARAKPSCDTDISGDPHCGERRIWRTDRRARGRRTGAAPRRPTGGRQLSFAGRSGGQTVLSARVGRGRAGQPLRARIRRGDPALGGPEQGHHGGCRGVAGKSARPVRHAAPGGQNIGAGAPGRPHRTGPAETCS